MDKILKSILIFIVGIIVTVLSASLLIRIIPYFGKLLLFIGFAMILFGFFSFLFRLFEKND